MHRAPFPRVSLRAAPLQLPVHLGTPGIETRGPASGADVGALFQVTLLESRDKHRGLGAGIAGGVRGFFGGLNRKGRDMPELRLAAGKVTDSADSESGKLRDGKKKGKTVDIDQIARLSRSDVAGEEDVSEYDDEAFTLKSEALQVSKPLQPGRTPLQASAEDKAETDGAAMLYDTKLASYVGNKGVSEKGTWAQAQVLGLDCGWSAIPHPAKADRGGEDVHLVCRAGGATMFGVFDGVGGWAELGVDPAEYARRLAQELEEQLLRDPSIATWQERPLLSMLEVRPRPSHIGARLLRGQYSDLSVQSVQMNAGRAHADRPPSPRAGCV